MSQIGSSTNSEFIFHHPVEDVNPQFPDFFTALYFGLTTLTTVGFGDITPITTSGRLVVAASILAGGAVIPFQLSRLAEPRREVGLKGNSGRG